MGNEGNILKQESVPNRPFVLQSFDLGISEKSKTTNTISKLHLIQPLPPPSTDLRHLTGAPDPHKTVFSTNAQTLSIHEPLLKNELKKDGKGLNEHQIKIYFKRFDHVHNPTQRDKAMKNDLETAKLKSPEVLKKDFHVWSAKHSAKTHSQPSSLEKVDAHIKTLPAAVRPIAEQAKIEGSRNILFYTLTGDQFDSAKPVNLSKDTKVIEPLLTRGEALAYMQSQNLTDGQGNPLKDTTADYFTSSANSIQTGELDRKAIVNWERQAIVNVLSGKPYKMKGQEIVHFMSSKGWLSDHPNVELMEGFRKRAAAHNEVEAVRQEVKTAKGTLSMDISERDRGDQILENLNHKKNKSNTAGRESRAGRENSKEEGRAGRDASLKAAKIREEGENKRARESREHQSEQAAKDREFKAKEAELEHKHRSAEDEKNRQNQMVMALIQFISQMISSALQAMSSTIAASIQGQQQLAGQIVGGMKGRA